VTRRGLAGLLLAAVSCSSSGGSSRAVSQSVLERNKNPSRDGLFVQPTLTAAAVAKMAPDTGFQATLTGTMVASPLYLENGPGGKGAFYAVTNTNDAFALDETTGAVIWTKNIGPAPAASGAGCGRIMPIGMISTPVIDAQARTIYMAGGVGTASIERHEVHALSVDDGSERPGWPVDVSQMTAGTLTFTPPPQNQRSALSLVNGIVYVAYGGHVGDCGPYHGWVVAIDTKDPKKTGAWATGGQGEGIWATGGMASDGTGVFAVTGNATSLTATHLDSEEVVHLTGLATLDRSTTKNTYYPANWFTMDAADADFGSTNPVYVTIPGSTPASYLLAISKGGGLYLLDPKNLGGLGGHVVLFDLAGGGAASLHGAPIAYTTPSGVHAAFYEDGGVLCPNGQMGTNIVSVLLRPGAPPTPRVVWCSQIAGGYSPIATSTDGKSDAIVWYMNTGGLAAVDGETGALLWEDTTPVCTGAQAWTSPIAVKGRIIVGAGSRLCSWSPH